MASWISRIIETARRHPLEGVGAASAAALALAWISEYAFGLRPCELCMLQRYPYMALVIIAAAGMWLAKAPRPRRFVIMLCAVILVGEAGLAGYHAGVEKGLFDGPSTCSGGSEPGMSIDDLRAQILGSQAVACNTPAIEIMGITMAGANAIYALLLLGCCVIALREREAS